MKKITDEPDLIYNSITHIRDRIQFTKKGSNIEIEVIIDDTGASWNIPIKELKGMIVR
jgi:hypothetical protein